jgi:hypothetical protein
LKRSNQLIIESAVIASVLIALTLGGSVETATIPPSFVALRDPGTVAVNHDLTALAVYYNTTLTDIGARNFTGSLFLLGTFHFVNIPPAVNATAQLANSDLSTAAVDSENASRIFSAAESEILRNQYVNATVLTEQGCALASSATTRFADFSGPRTSAFQSNKIPVKDYSSGESSASGVVNSLTATCDKLLNQLRFQGLELLIGSPQTSIETGGRVDLLGNLTFRGTGVGSESVLFYINGSYFGSLSTAANGEFSGALQIPFVYSKVGSVQALVAPNIPRNISGAASNFLYFTIRFNQTSIAIGDPPAVLPTFSFPVSGTLKTVSGTPLPSAPVNVTFFRQWQILTTNSQGGFSTRLTVPANATDGVYYVSARFAPEGVFGPSFNVTAVQVVHLPMTVTVTAPSLSLAGFSTTLTGLAITNDSSVAGGTIRVISPWGTFDGTTNSSGGFKISLPVSPWEFAFSRNVTIFVNATEPYVAIATVAKALAVFNVMVVIVPVAAVGIIGYEADRFGVFAALRQLRGRGQKGLSEEELLLEDEFSKPEMEGAISEAGMLYAQALSLARTKYSMHFRSSQTIREVVASVESRDVGKGATTFKEIMLIVEDAAYAKNFDAARLGAARVKLTELEGSWK